MLVGASGTDEFGFSLNPFHYAKKAVKTVAHDVRHPLDTAKNAAKAVGHGIKVGIIKPFEWVASKATAPIRNRVHQLRDRRAKKLAWDRRKSTTPNAQEKADAKSWTKEHLRKQGPHGEILQLFAGPMPMLLGNAQLGDPATLSLIAASIPIFMALMNKVLHKADASGEAPADPTKGGARGGPGALPPPGMPPAPGPDTGADASGGGAAAAGDDLVPAQGGGGAKILGMPKKYVIIGGAVLGGVLVLSLLTSKKGS